MSSRIKTEYVEINMGPQHPSTHGVLRLAVTLDGEVVVDCRPDVGYLHRGIEKLAEMRTYVQFIPITDRIDYLASMLQNAVYVGAVEKLGDIETPERARFIRVIMMELQRIASHLVFFGAWVSTSARPRRSFTHSENARISWTFLRWSAGRG